MLWKAIRWGIVSAALAAPLLSACIDNHTADECALNLNCPPDAGDGGDGSTDASGEGDH